MKIPPGWRNSPRDLARHNRFERGEGVCRILEDHDFSYIYPVMVDDYYDTYLIRGRRTGEQTPTFFVWYSGADMVLQVKSGDLHEIVALMGRSVLALDMVELEDIGLPEIPVDPVDPVDPMTASPIVPPTVSPIVPPTDTPNVPRDTGVSPAVPESGGDNNEPVDTRGA